MAKVLTIGNVRTLLESVVPIAGPTLTAATNASPSVVTFTAVAGRPTQVGDVHLISGITGLTALNGLRVVATVPSPTTCTYTDFVAGTAINGNGTFGGSPVCTLAQSALRPGDLVDLIAYLEKLPVRTGFFEDSNRAAEDSIATVTGA